MVGISDDSRCDTRPEVTGDRRDARRLFIAIRPAIATIAELAEVCETLARRAKTSAVPIRWLAPSTYHVTLKFLGWTPSDAVPGVLDAIRSASTVPGFTFATARLGAFPSRERASVVWAGVDCEPMARLAAALDAACSRMGFPTERRPFHGHITLGRLREPHGVSDVLLPFLEQTFSITTAHSIMLYETIIKSGSSEHILVERFDLQRQTPGLEGGQHDAPDGFGPRSPLEHIDTDDGWPRGQGPDSQ